MQGRRFDGPPFKWDNFIRAETDMYFAMFATGQFQKNSLDAYSVNNMTVKKSRRRIGRNSVRRL